MDDEKRETFERFAARVRAGADRIPIKRGGQSTTLAKLSEADRRAHIDRWYADGHDPLPPIDAEGLHAMAPSAQAARDRGDPLAPRTMAERASMNAYPVKPEEDPELFYGWVQRALTPGPGFEWAIIEIPRHIVEGLCRPDKAGRKLRQDTREVMTSEIIAELASWNLGNRARPTPQCRHRFYTHPRDGRVCVQCGTAEAAVAT